MPEQSKVASLADQPLPQFPDLPADFLAWQPVAVFVGTGLTHSLVANPGSVEDCEQVLAFCRRNKLNVCPKGSGRSYGDAILNDRNVILDVSGMNSIGELDAATGTISVGPGARLVDVFHKVHHLGWTIPASPTDSTISVGGALGANVNGKDSWRVGNFGDQILRLTVMTADGKLIDADRESNAELFMAVIGGMGLLGVVTEATIQLKKIPSPYLSVDISPADNVDDLIAKLDAMKDRVDFIVVWIDTYAKGSKLGRSVIHATSWIDSQLPEEIQRADVEKSVGLLATQKKRAVAFYSTFRHLINFGFHLQQIPIRMFNAFYFWMNNREKKEVVESTNEMFLEHNFDKSYTIPPPDILCGPHGYTVQITVPQGVAKEAMTEMLTLCQSVPCPPATTILRLHRKDDHVISFSEDGYSLNVEFHPKKRHAQKMAVFMEKFIECGIRYGSRVHLPKDITLTGDQFSRLFPRHEEFMSLKRTWDPDELFQSDMYRRLFRQ